MLCHQCGSPVSANEGSCSNCGAELRASRKLKLTESRGVRISQELKAIRLDQQLFPPGEEVAKRFVLGEMIGKGPFGEVYRARDKAIDAEVAVKIFVSAVLPSPLDEERFLQATRAGRRLNQQNLVRLHDSGVHKGNPWVSMQLLEGLSLRKVLDLRASKGETFTLAEVEPIVEQLQQALAHVAKDFPHGDLKPENIVFLPDLIKITDSFILASLPAKVIIPRLKENPYFAPELHTEKSEPTVRADVYSVGVIIGEMLFGPDYTPGSKSSGEFGPIDGVIKRATAFDPMERYSTVEDLAEDLESIIETGSLLAGKSSPPPPPTSQMPPAPPMGPAPSSVVEEDPVEDVATVEYNRELEQKLQDDILTREVSRDDEDKLTREVGRTVPAGTSRTVTAAVPKPSGPIPAPRPVQGDAPVKLIIGVAVLLVLLGFGLVSMSSTDDAPVEHIGQQPEQLGSNKPKAEEPTTSQTTTAKPEQTEPAVATTMAGEKVAAATAVATASTATQTNSATEQTPTSTTPAANNGSRPDPVKKAPVENKKPNQGTKSEPKDSGKKKATGSDCPDGMRFMKSKHGNFCIDAYEFPGRGSRPKTGVSWFQANKSCEAKGRRLCELKEWRSACGGRYPYGRTHDPDKCNTADEDGFERSLAKTGSFKQCKGRGVYDMVGNAHEWVKEQRIAGGGFESDEEVGSCRYSSPKSPASSAGYIGFRCCADPN